MSAVFLSASTTSHKLQNFYTFHKITKPKNPQKTTWYVRATFTLSQWNMSADFVSLSCTEWYPWNSPFLSCILHCNVDGKETENQNIIFLIASALRKKKTLRHQPSVNLRIDSQQILEKSDCRLNADLHFQKPEHISGSEIASIFKKRKVLHLSDAIVFD